MGDAHAAASRQAPGGPRPGGDYAGERLSWEGPRDGGAEPAVARPAATVMLLRDGASTGLEVFMVRRNASSRFAADAFVFPGGAVQPEDSSERALAGAPSFTPDVAHARLTERGGDPPSSRELSFGLHVAALRELFEEAGVLLADNRQAGLPADAEPVAPRLEAERRGVQRGELSLAALAERENLELAPERLVYFSHWVTPELSPRRFDTRFFVAAMPAGQTALHCRVETTEGEWLAPASALARCRRGEVKLIFVTIRHLERLAAFPTVSAALRSARQKAIRTVRPTPAPSGRGWTIGPEDAW